MTNRPIKIAKGEFSDPAKPLAPEFYVNRWYSAVRRMTAGLILSLGVLSFLVITGPFLVSHQLGELQMLPVAVYILVPPACFAWGMLQPSAYERRPTRLGWILLFALWAVNCPLWLIFCCLVLP